MAAATSPFPSLFIVLRTFAPLAIVPIAWALIDPHRQGLHDKLAGTLVVRTT